MADADGHRGGLAVGWLLALPALDGGRAPFDAILVAAGRRAVTDELGLGAASVELGAGGEVVVDDRLRTSSPHVYAVGDVTGRLAFTHAAAYQGRLATANALFGTRRRARYERVPSVTFTDPEVARIGLTEAQARAR